jgi:hypothetical protein
MPTSIRQEAKLVKSRLTLWAACALLLSWVSTGCIPSADPTSELGRSAIAETTLKALDKGDCAAAYIAISPYYLSEYSDNTARMLAASTYGCFANAGALAISLEFMNNTIATPTALWAFITEIFPSTATFPSDKVVEYGSLGIDALFSTIAPGTVVIPAETVNAASFNPGSMRVADRVSDANIYLFFMSMAVIGGTHNRYGTPDGAFLPTTPFPNGGWDVATEIDATACEYASAVVNFADGLSELVTATSGGALGPTIANVQTLVQSALFTACDDGCTGASGTGCAIAAGCSGCPMALRSRASCTGVATDASSCAAAGLVRLIRSPFGWGP